MKRSWIGWMAVLFAATSANAASLNLTYSGTPETGNTITLELYVSVAPADGTDGSLYASLLFPSSGIVTPVTAGVQFAFPSDGGSFGLGALSCTSVRCVTVNQVSVLGPQTGNVSDFLIATQDYTITGAAGSVLTWNWVMTPITHVVSIFDAVPAVPALEITVIPEPATAALLGMGLLALAAARHRK